MKYTKPIAFQPIRLMSTSVLVPTLHDASECICLDRPNHFDGNKIDIMRGGSNIYGRWNEVIWSNGRYIDYYIRHYLLMYLLLHTSLLTNVSTITYVTTY